MLFRDDYIDQEKRSASILAYNDWFRSFARDNKVPLLDLEAAVARGTGAKHLPDALHSGMAFT